MCGYCGKFTVEIEARAIAFVIGVWTGMFSLKWPTGMFGLVGVVKFVPLTNFAALLLKTCSCRISVWRAVLLKQKKRKKSLKKA